MQILKTIRNEVIAKVSKLKGDMPQPQTLVCVTVCFIMTCESQAKASDYPKRTFARGSNDYN